MKKSTKKTVRAGIIASLYVILSLITFSFASSVVQLRLSEALTLMPLLLPESIVGITVGCIISNVITGCNILEAFLGGGITLIAGILTLIFGKIIKNGIARITVGGIFPVMLNALLLPLIWYLCYGKAEYLYFAQVGLLICSQSISVYLIGIPVFIYVKKFISKNPELFD